MGEYDFNDLYTTQDRNISSMNDAININSVNVYRLMTEAYYGTGGFRSGRYLVPYSRESDYRARQRLSYYKNYFRPVIRSMVEPVFSEEVPRTVTDGNNDVDNMFKTFIDDVDTTGTSMQEYSHSLLKVCRRHGVVFTVMDNFASDLQPSTVAEAKAERVMPYIYMKQADEVADYQTDRFGSIEWIIFDDIPEVVNNKREMRYRKWTRTESILMKKSDNGNFIPISTEVHNLGRVPVIVSYSDIPEKKGLLLVDPPLYDIVRINTVIYNQAAEIRDQERAQAFSIFYVQGIPEGDNAFGPKNYINLDYNVNIAPGYASPDFNIIKGLVENEEQNRADLFLICEQAGVVGVESSESGVAKAYDFYAHEDTLKRTSYIASELEYKISDLFQLYTGEQYDYQVDYPVDFAPLGADREIDRFDKVLKMPDLNPLLKSRLQEKLAKVLFADVDREILDEILLDIRTRYDQTQAQIKAQAQAPVMSDAEEEEIGSIEEPVLEQEKNQGSLLAEAMSTL